MKMLIEISKTLLWQLGIGVIFCLVFTSLFYLGLTFLIEPGVTKLLLSDKVFTCFIIIFFVFGFILPVDYPSKK